MKLDKYYVVEYVPNEMFKSEYIARYTVKAKNVKQAVDNFYKVDGGYYLKKGYQALSVKRLEIEVLENESRNN